MNIEIWNDVVGYEDLYQVSNLGRVKSLNYQGKKGKTISEGQKEKIRKSNMKRKGLKIGITKNGVSYHKIYELHQKGYSINKISKELNYDWKQVKTRLEEIYENPELLEGNR